MAANFGNIYFLAVARVNGRESIVVASYSHNTETDLNAVRQVLDQPNMKITPGKFYNFSVGQLAWSLIGGII